jgi:hypothetical protein
MIHKNEDAHTIGFLDMGEQEKSQGKKQVNPANKKKSISGLKAKKLDNSKAIENGRKAGILSAGQGDVSDIGGPSKHAGSMTNNTIWDSDALSNFAGVSGEEEIKKSKQEQAKRKEAIKEKQRQENYADSDVDLRKQSTINSLSGTDSDELKNTQPRRNLSIFDTNRDFEQIPELSPGEKSVREKKQEKSRKNEHSSRPGTLKTEDTVNRLFDALRGDNSNE